MLRSRLIDLWRIGGSYPGAIAAVCDALRQDYFSASTRTWVGVRVMTIHNSKLKEFEEIFIYEGHHQGRIVRPNASANKVAKYVWYSESQLLGRRYGLQSSRPGLMCVGFSNPDMYRLERIVSKIKQLLRALQAPNRDALWQSMQILVNAVTPSDSIICF